MDGLGVRQLELEWECSSAEQEARTDLALIPEMCGNDYAFLRSMTPLPVSQPADRTSIPLVDLFCGVGGLSLGFHEAASAVGLKMHTALAIDNDEQALDCYRDNLGGSDLRTNDIRDFFAPHFDARLSSAEQQLRRKKLTGGILIGGPPCQGHSDLNNSTRRNDPKNSLYFIMARAARVLEPAVVVIENVPAVVHDRNGVVAMTRDAIESLGYSISEHVFDLASIGVPQTRKRHILVACTLPVADRMEKLARVRVPVRTVEWAIRDLEALLNRESLLDKMATPNQTTRKRIDYLFDNELYSLPNSQRPPCHRLKDHSYKSIYGRLSWNSPAQTITRGFYCMCMGRYVHPSERRTLTAHEAARLQFFPDWFSFERARTRTHLATMLGNAVPSKLGFLLGHELLYALKFRGGKQHD